VDIYVPGCPPKPEAIIDGVVAGLSALSEKDGRDVSPVAEELSEMSATYSERYENFKTGEEK
jgi:NADH:ubiquinone oxidoreductase subunit B-like Fe-S oxidoreductase